MLANNSNGSPRVSPAVVPVGVDGVVAGLSILPSLVFLGETPSIGTDSEPADCSSDRSAGVSFPGGDAAEVATARDGDLGGDGGGEDDLPAEYLGRSELLDAGDAMEMPELASLLSLGDELELAKWSDRIRLLSARSSSV